MTQDHGDGRNTDGLLRTLVDFVERAKTIPLSARQNEAVALRVLDAMGCALYASSLREVRKICQGVLEMGGIPRCSVLMHGKASPEQAGYLNSSMIRYLDLNDYYHGGGHPSDIIGGVFAVGEFAARSGKDVARALAISTHVMIDFIDACAVHFRGWDYAVYAGIATAISSAILLDLSPEQTRHAISLNVIANNVFLGRTGKLSAWKGLAAPTAVRNGIFAAFSARSGVTGPEPVFEGKSGFLKHVTGPITPELNPQRDRTGDLSMKRYVAGAHAQATVELCLELRRRMAQELGTPDPAGIIDAVTIWIHKGAVNFMADKAKWFPQNRETADHSIPFLAALALCLGECGFDAMDEGLRSDRVRALTQRVAVDADPVFTEQAPRMAPTRINISARGRDFVAEIPSPSGHWSRPMSKEEVLSKFFENATKSISRNRAEAWAEKIARLHQLDRIGDFFDF